jgi:D-glycero-alpha-D-manno-heptose-7-phosphate kinase
LAPPFRQSEAGVIISRTPFRVSLAGGGSDLAAYYRLRAGCVVTMAMNRYMYVTVNRRFDDTIRVSYTRTEIVEHVDDVQHDLVRESMRMVGLIKGLEVTTIADLPAGIGLGSSSSLTVGLLNALYTLKGEWHSPADLARRACEIEIEVLKHPIGKQDQYIAAFGGFCEIRFLADDTVSVHPIVCPRERRDELVGQLMLFYTGVSRDANTVLQEAQERMIEGGRSPVDGLVAFANEMRNVVQDGGIERVGELLDASWLLKKQMASTVSNGHLDRLYECARRAGAAGGKISGAGAGGCLLLFVPGPRQHDVRHAMHAAGLKEVVFAYEPEGSRIVHYAE